MNMLDKLPPEQQHYVLAHVNSADGHVDGAHGRVDGARGQVCKQCFGLKADPIGIKKGCTCCSCDGCDACSNKGVKIYLPPEKCGVDRIGRTSTVKIITKCENCNRLARQRGNERRSSDLRRLKDMEAKIAVAGENVDIAQQRPAATLGDTTQLAVQLAEQLCSIAPASSLPAASVQPQCDGSMTEVPVDSSSSYPPALLPISSPLGVAGAAGAPTAAATDQVLPWAHPVSLHPVNALAFESAGQADSAARATTAAASA